MRKMDKREELGIRVLEACRNSLYRQMPFLDGAFSAVSHEASSSTKTIATQGDVFAFCPEFLVKAYAESPERVRRGYLHMLIHCLYLHPFQRQSREKELWNLACDLAVERTILENWPGEEDLGKEDYLQKLGEARSAQQIYRLLEKEMSSADLEKIGELFSFDDHSIWEPDTQESQGTRRKWEKLAAYTSHQAGEARRRVGSQRGYQTEELEDISQGKYDYRKFLRRFTIPREELELDLDSFDYIFYHLGLERYGNMPLIEPLEYREVNRLEELVIAIDTSGSCSSQVVRRFLEETYRILSSRENFFRKMKVYLIQCDCCIQDVAVIHSEEEWKNCSRNIRIQGRGGTDFCPVFRYVEQLREQKKLKNLRALIYFTDGDGVYPRSGPDYETAFVFIKKTDKMDLVPPWATRLLAEA